MVVENDRGRTDICAKHIDGPTDPVRTDLLPLKSVFRCMGCMF